MNICFQKDPKDFLLISTVVVFHLWLNFDHLGPTKHARVKGTLALGATLLSLSLTLVNPFLFGFNAARFLGGQFESVWTLLNWTLTFPFVTRLACPLLQFHVGAIWGLVALGWSALECKTAPSSLVSVHRPPRLSVFKLVLFPVSAKVHFGWVCSFRRRRTGWSNALHGVYTNVSAHIQDSDHSEDPNIPAIAHRLLWPLPRCNCLLCQLWLQQYMQCCSVLAQCAGRVSATTEKSWDECRKIHK